MGKLEIDREGKIIIAVIVILMIIVAMLLTLFHAYRLEAAEPKAIEECEPPAYARIIATAYTSRVCETDDTPYQTATMDKTRSGIIGISRDLEGRFPMGSRVCFWYAGRVQTFFVQDRMNARWRNRIDVWMPTVAEAMRFGKQSLILWG